MQNEPALKRIENEPAIQQSLRKRKIYKQLDGEELTNNFTLE